MLVRTQPLGCGAQSWGCSGSCRASDGFVSDHDTQPFFSLAFSGIVAPPVGMRRFSPIIPSQTCGFYGEGSREGSCSPNSSLCLCVLFPSVVFYLATAPRRFCQLAPEEDGLRLGTCADSGSAGTFQPHLSLGTDLPEGPVGEETY